MAPPYPHLAFGRTYERGGGGGGGGGPPCVWPNIRAGEGGVPLAFGQIYERGGGRGGGGPPCVWPNIRAGGGGGGGGRPAA